MDNRISVEKAIVEKKNLDRKLENLQEDDYKRIVSNLENHNKKLKEQLKQMGDKVNELLQKRKLQKKTGNKLIESEIQKTKNELEQKYKIVDQLKKEIKIENEKRLEIYGQVKILKFQNMEVQITREKDNLLKEKKMLENIISENTQALKEYSGDHYLIENQKYRMILQENRNLKKKISTSKKNLTERQKISQEVIDKLISLKLQHRKRISLQQPQSKLSSRNKIEQYQVQQLELQIEQLKQKKIEFQKNQEKEKGEYENKKSRIQKKIRQNLEIQKELAKQKIKSLSKLNLYENIQAKKQSQLKNQQNKQTYTDASIQTESPIVYNYRRDWVGRIGKISWDDAKILLQRKKSKIIKMKVYLQNQNIVTIKFTYNNNGNLIESIVPIDQTYLINNTTMTVFQTKDNQYIKFIKVGVKEQKIVYLELSTNMHQVFQIGKKIPQFYYILDIKQNQRPICAFVSMTAINKKQRVLQSLGFEIEQQQY